MYKDRKHHNYLMLELRRLKEFGATTIDTSNGTLFEAVQEARQVLDNDYSHLTGKERWYADVDVALAKWAVSVATRSSNGHITQRAAVDKATRRTPQIDDGKDPVLQQLSWMKLSKNDLRIAVARTEIPNALEDAIRSVFLESMAGRQYRYGQGKFYSDWTNLARIMEAQGLAVRLEEWGIQLTEQGKAWLNEASDSSGAGKAVGAEAKS